jgi:hypothetical protein
MFISGPYSWFQEHPIAINGHRQSPIHILTKEVVKDEILKGIPLRSFFYVFFDMLNFAAFVCFQCNKIGNFPPVNSVGA